MASSGKRFLGASPEQWMLIVALPLNQAANTALFTVLGPFRADFGLSYVELGIVLASYGLARFAMDVPAGVLIRRFPLRAALIVGLIANLAAAVGPLGANAVWQLVAARIVQGTSSSIVQAAILAWLIIGAHSSSRGRVMALSEAFFSVVGLSVPLATGALAIAFGWRAAFVTATVASVLACAAILLGTGRGSAPQTTAPQAGSGELAKSGLRASIAGGGVTLAAAYLLAFIVAFSRFGLLNTLIPVIGSDELGLTPLQVGYGLTLANVAGILVLMAGGWAGDRFGRRRLAVPGIALLLLCQLALFAITSRVRYFGIVTFQGAGFFMNSFPTSLVGDALPPHLRSIGIAGYRLVTDAAILIAPIVVGVAIDWGGLNAPKAVTMILTVIGLALVWSGTRRRPPLAAKAAV